MICQKTRVLVVLVIVAGFFPTCGASPRLAVVTQTQAATGTQAAGTTPQVNPSNSAPDQSAVDIYVSTSGDDARGKGSPSSPYLTIARAMQDIPTVVAQHYIIHLAAGTYYEQVNATGHVFATNLAGSIAQASIEIDGDVGNPDAFVISGATPGAPTVAARPYGVVGGQANLILKGVSAQFATVSALMVRGGVTVVYNTTYRHVRGTQNNNAAVWVRSNGFLDVRGNNTISDAEVGLFADSGAYVSSWSSSANELFNTGFPVVGTTTISDIVSGQGMGALEGGYIDLVGTTNISCTNVPGSFGIWAWERGWVVLSNASITNCPTAIFGQATSRVFIDTATLTSAMTGVELHNQSLMDWFVADPTLASVTTPYIVDTGSRVVSPTKVLSDGQIQSTGPINLTAGGANQNITLTPSGNGSIVLDGLVGVGGPSTGAKLMVTGPGGKQDFVHVDDTEADQDTLVRLDASGNQDNLFLLRAKVDGTDRWWVKSNGSMFSTTLSTAINIVPFSASPVFYGSLGDTQKITLSGNVAGSILEQASPGQRLTFIICQDSSGGHSFTWPPNVRGGMPIGMPDMMGVPIGAAPNTCSTQAFIFDGNLAYALSPGMTNM